MRPKLLKISAFGPFAGEVSVDFARLGNSGIYLVTGDTGAGKTTLFDSIAYALYGQVSGSTRDETALRCKYAEKETPSFVELTFTYRGQDYFIRRTPRYLRPSRRGDKTVEEKPSACLKMPNGEIREGVAEVNAAVVELIGLTKLQFSQIAMIAQGEFLRLLNADTKERMEIFRGLFATDKYEKLTEQLSLRYSELKKRYDEQILRLKHICGEIEPNESDNELLAAFIADDGVPEAAIVSEIVERAVNADDKKSAELTEKITKIAVEIEETLKLHEKAVQQAELLKQRGERQAKLCILNGDLQRLSAEYGQSAEKDGELDELSKFGVRLAVDYPLYDELDSLQATALADENTVAGLKAAVDTTLAEQERLREQQRLGEHRREELREVPLKKEKIKAEFVAEGARLEKIKAVLIKCDEYDEALAAAATAQNDYLAAQREYDAAASRHLAAQKAYYDSQAGILAQRLTNGEPCPVCGSTTHPSPTPLAENAVTEQELQLIEKQCKSKEAAMGERSKTSHKATGRLSQVEKELLSSAAELSEQREIAEIRAAFTTLCKQCENVRKELRTAAERLNPEVVELEQLEQQSKADSEKLPILGAKYENAIKEYTAAETSLSSKKARIGELLKILPFENKAAAQKRVDEINLEVAAHNTKKQSLQAAVQDCKKDLDELSGELKAIEKSIDAEFTLSVAELSTKIDALKSEKAQLDGQFGATSLRLQRNRKQKSAFKASAEMLAKIESDIAVVKPLADTAGGKLGGKERFMLETYVQTAYFDRILRRANIRLIVMSGGRYELRRRQEAQDKRQRIGLELDIVDHYGNETLRSVKTLSGGESFQASLALALGLSDEVQSSCGGISLDTMFIDEGFGALDENALYQAVQTLEKLGNSNKLIGVISHIGSLKAMLTRQIVVTKNKNGSTVRVEI